MTRFSLSRRLSAMRRRLAVLLRAHWRGGVFAALGTLIVAGVVGGLMRSSPVTISVVAATDMVVVRRSCDQKVSLRLPAGRLQRSEKTKDGLALTHEKTSCSAIGVIVPRVDRLAVVRRQGGALNLQMSLGHPGTASASCGEEARESCVRLTIDGKVLYWPGSPDATLSFSAQDQSGGDCQGRVLEGAATFQMPFSGELEIGGFPSRSPGNEPLNLLYSGEIRVRSRGWITGDRIELGTRALEAGDFVRTHFARTEPDGLGTGCDGSDATGVVWSTHAGDSDGGLRVVAHRVADNVEVVRSSGLRVGVSVLEQIVAQPVVRFLWQALVAAFALAAGYASLRALAEKDAATRQ